eukprot:SAG31_NODE_4186_length_3492_cov_1.799587_2_plen_390_part_00
MLDGSGRPVINDLESGADDLGTACYFLVFVQLFEKYGTLIERYTALIEKVSALLVVSGLPQSAGVRWVKWRGTGGAVAFLVRPDVTSDKLELWCAEFHPDQDSKSQTCTARPLIQDRTLHSICVPPHCWTSKGDLLVKVVPAAAKIKGPPVTTTRPAGPNVQQSIGSKKPARTYQDLLKSQHDVKLFQYYMTSELLLLSQPTLIGGASISRVSPPGGVMLRTFIPAPDSSCVLCTVVTPGDHSFLVPYQRFGHRHELWSIHTPTTAPAIVSRTPLQESVPIGRDARTVGPRSMGWHPTFPATLIWVAALDGGDPKNSAGAANHRDMLYTQAAAEVFARSATAGAGAVAANGAGPVKLFGMERRLSGWWFTARGVGMIRERWFKDRCVKI